MFTRRHRIQLGWLLYGTGAIASLLYSGLILFAEPSSESETILYTPVMLRYWGIKALVILILLVIGSAGLLYFQRRNLDAVVGLAVPPLIMLVVSLYVTQPTIGDSRLTHVEALPAEGHIYNLADRHLLRLVLYECDGLSVICRRIYEGSTVVSLTPSYTAPHLEIHGNRLNLMVQGQSVFEYIP